MKRSPLVITALLAALLLSAGCTQSSSLTVKLSDHSSIGSILTDSNGRALYFLAKDVPGNSKPTDLGEFSRYYPPFFAETMVSSPGINISDFGILTRPDGKKQTTYRGWPLYYYFNDKNPGDLKLDTASNIWFAIRPDYTLMVEEKDQPGLYLTDAAGKALYVYGNGSASTAAASPDTTLPTPSVKNETGKTPFYTARASGPSVLNLRDFGVINRPDGSTQSTWRGMPLAYSTADKVPGDTLGEGNGWSLVRLAPAVSIASFGNLTVSGQAAVQNQTLAQTKATTATTVATTMTTVPTTVPTTVATTSTSTYVIPVYPVSNGDGSFYYPVTVNTTMTATGSPTQITSSTVQTPAGQVNVTASPTSLPVTTVTKTQTPTEQTRVTTAQTTPTTVQTLPPVTTPPTKGPTTVSSPATTVPTLPPTTVLQTTVPTLPPTTVAQTTIPIPILP